MDGITGSENFLVGKICIARYGKIFRGNKVHNCQTKGAKGKQDNNLKFVSSRISGLDCELIIAISLLVRCHHIF